MSILPKAHVGVEVNFDHIHGDVLLKDMPYEIIFPSDLIIDGNIKVLTLNECWVREQNWTHISAKNKEKMIFL